MNDSFINHGINTNASGQEQQRTTCPKCTPDRRKQHLKDLSVNLFDGTWFCHHCGWKGGLNGKNTSMPINKLIQPKKKVEYVRPTTPIDYNIPDDVQDWFSGRGISVGTLTKCKVTVGDQWMPQTGNNETCITFNYFVKGELVNQKHRDSLKNMRMHKGAELVMYAPRFDKNSDIGIITEGEIDAISMVECGHTNVVSLPNGALPLNVDITKLPLPYLKSLDDIAPKVTKWILAMDNDDVGIKMRDELAARIGLEKCYKPTYQEGCKDINDILVKFGKDAVSKIVEDAKTCFNSGVVTIVVLDDEIMNLYNNGRPPAMETNKAWMAMNSHYMVRKKQLTLITGIPSHGKSAWLDNVMVSMALDHDWRFAIYSPENFPYQEHAANMMEIIVGKPFEKGYNGRMIPEEMDLAKKFMADHHYYIWPDKDDHTIDDILEHAAKIKKLYGIDGLIIDPWTELEHSRGDSNETDYISKSLTKVRRFVREKDIHCWIVAHPTKIRKDKNGEYPIVTPHDIAGSKNWYAKADNCLTMHRDFEANINTVYIQKIRFKGCGKLGAVDFKFERANNTFTEVGQQPY